MNDQNTIFGKADQLLEKYGLEKVKEDKARPWGGFYVIRETQAPDFIEAFFPALKRSDFEGYSKLSPKLLMVAPGKRLSWQYHNRRSEIWRVIHGAAGVVVSDTDEQGAMKILYEGETLSLKEGERHRLVGLDDWAILAEIWQHTRPEHPSDEEDIVRLEDDFGR